MKLIVFLGNPGEKYKKTRHNAGFLLADHLQAKWDFTAFKKEVKFKGKISKGIKEGQKIIFLKPQTYMNLSGESVRAVKSFYKITDNNLLIVHDDKDLAFSSLRFRDGGGSGGHKGILSIMNILKTENFARLKIGVERREKGSPIDTSDFVLSRFTDLELRDLETEIFPMAEFKVREWLKF